MSSLPNPPSNRVAFENSGRCALELSQIGGAYRVRWSVNPHFTSRNSIIVMLEGLEKFKGFQFIKPVREGRDLQWEILQVPLLPFLVIRLD
jgi:hypothetical protein